MHKVAIVFSGQGAQYSGMGKELYNCSPAAKEVFELCERLRSGTIAQCFEGSKEELSLTINTQPCLFAMDLAAGCALAEAGIKPSCVAGFSLGEIAAIAFVGILSYEDAFKLVCKRAELMHEAAQKNKGAMAAVLGLSPAAVEEICASLGSAYPVNYNCPGQIVVAFSEELLTPLLDAVKAAGGKAIRLAVSGAFHTPFMQQASEELSKYLSAMTLHNPVLPVYSNYTAAPYVGDMKALIINQIKSPVLWQKTIENISMLGIDTFIEVGAGKTLCGLINKILSGTTVFNVENVETLSNTLLHFKGEN